jgi:hypothetical protein
VREYKRHSFAHFALLPWNVPDNKYVDTVVELAHSPALLLFALGSSKVTAFAKLVAARAYRLSQLNLQTPLREGGGGRQRAVDVARGLAHETQPGLEKAVVLRAYERVPARRIASRRPETIVKERRRQAYAVATKRGSTPSQA